MEGLPKLEFDCISSAAAEAIVEGGNQDSCEDSCSVCLEPFCDSDPSSVTECKHEYHIKCILEWCQRSSQCPMCWQPISFKDPTSQELFDAVERERNIRSNPTQNTAIFHLPTLGEFELQHLPVGASDEELQERIIEHLAAAAAIRRARYFGRREGMQRRPSAHGRPTQLLVFSGHQNAPSLASISASPARRGENEPGPADFTSGAGGGSSLQVPSIIPAAADRVAIPPAIGGPFGSNRGSSRQCASDNQDRAGPSDFQSFSESLKSRLNAVSMRYKGSLTRNAWEWKERLFSWNPPAEDLGPEARREADAGMASVSRMMERLRSNDNVIRVSGGVPARRGPEHSSAVELSCDDEVSDNRVHAVPASRNVSSYRTAISRS